MESSVVGVVAAEFLMKAADCRASETLHRHFLVFAQAVGFHSALFINLSNGAEPVLPRVVLGGPDPWIDYYVEQNYAGLDPTLPRAFRSRAPFTWSSVEQPDAPRSVRLFFDEARDAWTHESLIVPIHGPFGEFSVVNLLCDHPIRLSSEETAVIQGVCQIYVAAALTLDAGALPGPPDLPVPLSRRERQCLFWMSMGRRDVDTAKILGISSNTVRGYLDIVKQKLDVETRPELSLKALAFGLLVPDRGGTL